MKISETIRELRKAMNVSQEHLARRLDLSLRTIARYENDQGLPPDDLLLTFADLASEAENLELAADFRFLYLDKISEKLRFNLIVDPVSEKREIPRGYLVLKLEGQEQIDDVLEFLEKRRGPTDHDAIREGLEAALFGRNRKKTQ
jgi:transcriptional regulator with XRE-family HTH domain